MSDILCVVSGGLDSITMAYHFEEQRHRVSTVTFNYGQRHFEQEVACAQRHAYARGWQHDIIDLTDLAGRLRSTLIYDGDVPEGHYTNESMKATIVPNRNAIMLSIATGIAVSRDVSYVATAVHAGDHPIYPDCRPGFIQKLSIALQEGNEGSGFKGILYPFSSVTKNWIAQRAVDLGVDPEGTYSCYKGGSKHCGRCGTCVERMEALWSTNLYRYTAYPSEAWRRAQLFPASQYEDNTYWMEALEGAK